MHDSIKILKYSADLSHYIGDAHVPLHTTSNHNGQLTNQVGIHAFGKAVYQTIFDQIQLRGWSGHLHRESTKGSMANFKTYT